MEFDYHIHSNYSDGRLLWQMARAAEEAGLSGVGFADHCNVSEREGMNRMRSTYGFNLDVTYERRRIGIERLNDRFDLRVFDACEMDYDPRDETAIESFLDEAGFDYVIGSIHSVDDRNVQMPSQFADDTDRERQAVVDEYYDTLVSLVESELFDIAAHADLLERNPALRGRSTDEHYERVADAFSRSRTIPELNGGRVIRGDGTFHPAPRFLEVLLDHDVPVTLGTDAHSPEQLTETVPVIRSYLEDAAWEPATLDLP